LVGILGKARAAMLKWHFEFWQSCHIEQPLTTRISDSPELVTLMGEMTIEQVSLRLVSEDIYCWQSPIWLMMLISIVLRRKGTAAFRQQMNCDLPPLSLLFDLYSWH